jgi:chromosomal replication initiator protein
MLDTREIWNSCLRDIEKEVSSANFSTWFKNTHIAKEDSGTIYVGVPNEFVKEWLATKYMPTILRTLMTYLENARSVEFTITRFDRDRAKDESPVHILPSRELPLKDLYINKEDNLNPRYTFDTFIVGSFNELAYAAGQAIINKPGVLYNPFFIYGSTGLGKTHLIQATGNAIKEKYPEKKVHYITLEKFANDYINSLQSNSRTNTFQFKEKYRKYDCIVIDDIQFIGKMEKTQEELFHLFNTFYDHNKQIIFSSDKHPNFIPGLEDRLKSRFAAGMIVDVIDPDYESRVAILKAKSRQLGIEITDEVMSFIATSIQGNIRELEGVLNTIIVQTQLKQKPLSINEIKNLIKNSVKPKKNVSVKDIVKLITDFYNLEEATVYEKTRRKEIVKARQVIMYILREDFNVSYPLIGQKLGGKDHTTVIHSHLKIRNDLKTDQTLVDEVEQIRVLFKSV